MAKARKKKAVDSKYELQELVTDISASLDKQFKASEFKSAYFLDDDTTVDVNDFVPTGLDILDLAISNRPHGGWPVGRISEITGLEASGKSLLAAYALRNTQKKGGIAVYIDTEAAVSKDYLEAIGVDTKTLVYIPLEAIEDVFTSIETIVEKVRKANKDRLVTIVVDSVMGATTKTEQEAEHGKDGYATAKSIIMSKGLRKITNMIARQKICLLFTNQLRVKMGVMFGDKYTTAGGKALGFHASVRVRLKSQGRLSKVVNGIKNVIGIKTECGVVKNRLGPPLKKVTYDIYYASGIDNFGSWLTALKDYKVVTGDKKAYKFKLPSPVEYIDVEGEVHPKTTEIVFTSSEFATIVRNNPEIDKMIYNMICDKYIMNYEINKDFGIDDIEVSSGEDPFEEAKTKKDE